MHCICLDVSKIWNFIYCLRNKGSRRSGIICGASSALPPDTGAAPALSSRSDSSHALGLQRLSPSQRWCAEPPRGKETNHTALGASPCTEPRPWHPAHTGLLPFPALPTLGKSYLVMLSRGEGRKVKKEQGGGKHEAVTKFGEWKASAFQKCLSTSPWPTGGRHGLPYLLPRSHSSEKLNFHQPEPLPGFMSTCHPQVSWVAASPTPPRRAATTFYLFNCIQHHNLFHRLRAWLALSGLLLSSSSGYR